MAWTIDATSGKAIPQTIAEWTSFLASNASLANWSVPDALYLLQDASGNPVDASGNALTLTATGTGLAYRQSVAGWSAKAITTTVNDTGLLKSTSASLPDLSVGSQLGLVIALISSIGASGGGLMQTGVSSNRMTLEFGASPNRFKGFSNLVGATGTNDPTAVVRPFVLQSNFSTGASIFYSDQEVITPTRGTVSGKVLALGAAGSSGVTPTASLLYSPWWFNAKATRTQADVGSLLECLGWSPTWVTDNATLASTLDSATLAGTAAVKVQVQVAATLDDTTLAATAIAPAHATETTTLDSVTLAAAAAAKAQAALGVTLGDTTLAAAATVTGGTSSATLDVTLGDVTVAADVIGTTPVNTVQSLRDHIIELIADLAPAAFPDDAFLPYLNEDVADFRAHALRNPAGALRRYQVRDTGDDRPPDVSTTDVAGDYVTFQILIAYPQNARSGPANALDRDDLISSDQHQLEQTVGLNGYANFTGPDVPNAAWTAGAAARELAAGVDFLALTLTMRFFNAVNGAPRPAVPFLGVSPAPTFPVAPNATTAAAIRNRMLDLIEQLAPASDVAFLRYLNEGDGNFERWCEANPTAARRRVQVRDLGNDKSPAVTNTDVEERLVTFRVLVAYPQTARDGPGNALGRDDTMKADQQQIERAIGVSARANFLLPNPDACWRSSKTRRIAGTHGIDYLEITQTMSFRRTMQ